MKRSISLPLVLVSAALVVGVIACGKNSNSSSELKDIAKPLNIGDATDHHGKPEVLIYYANETAPDKTEQANWDSVIATLRGDDKTKFIAETLTTDLAIFPIVVDQEVAALTDYFCSEKNKLNTSLVVFTNRLVRAGGYQYCHAGQPVKTSTDTYFGKFQKEQAADFRALSNPLANVKTLRWALARTRLIFKPADYLYSFVMKSHGNAENILTPRLAVMSKKIDPNVLLTELKKTIVAPAPVANSTDAPSPAEKANLEDFRKESDNLRDQVAASDTNLDKLIKNELGTNEELRDSLWKNELVKNELMKNELVKNELVKNELLKNELVKNELLKNELIKNELMKNELVKNELLKNELLKNELVKNELVKNELVKNELLKNELVKNELVKNELIKNELSKNELAADGETAADGVKETSPLAKAVLPRIGVSKREFLAELAATGIRSQGRMNMYFSVVFTEACRSYIPWDLKMDIAEADGILKIDYLASSDEGSVKYQNIDYPKFLASLDQTKSFGENFRDELDRISATPASK